LNAAAFIIRSICAWIVIGDGSEGAGKAAARDGGIFATIFFIVFLLVISNSSR
jgi:hypothetical protein